MDIGTIILGIATWIGNQLLEEATFLGEVENELCDLREELVCMQRYVRDADEHGMNPELDQHGDGQFSIFTTTIQNLAFDAEDVVDYSILKLALGTRAISNDQKFLKRFSACFFMCYKATTLHQVGKEIIAIQKKVEEANNRLKTYGWTSVQTTIPTSLEREGSSSRSSSSHTRLRRRRPQSSPYEEGYECVIGLEEDIKNLVQQLTTNDPVKSNQQVGFLSIVGMGGCGKTTLARKLYNHPIIKQYYSCLAWVAVSQEWDPHHLLLEILRQVGGCVDQETTTRQDTQYHNWSIERLVHEVRGVLLQENKSYLIFLDDVWRVEALEDILPAFPLTNKNNDVSRSQIVITTRIRDILLQVPNIHCSTYEPTPLNEDQGWKLFSTIVFGQGSLTNIGRNYNPDLEVEKLSKEMLVKCDGLPLAIVSLAGILATKESISGWEQVGKALKKYNLITEYGIGTQPIYRRVKDMLALSYYDLPDYLKPCFLYMGLFPEDYEIRTGMLTRMWIAEGFLANHHRCYQEEEDSLTLEDVAMVWVEELLQRCVVQVVSRAYDGKVKACQLHDLMRDFCVSKAKQLGLNHRQATINHGITLPSLEHANLRSLFRFQKSIGQERLNMEPIVTNFKLLRVLSLWRVQFIPDQVGKLLHLRYLSIRHSSLHEIPRSIGNLKNLVVLDLKYSSGILPDVVWKLERVRHLYFGFVRTCDPKLDALKNLQTLCGVDGGDWMIKGGLTRLSHNIRKLWTRRITSSEQANAILESLGRFKHLRSLFLYWQDGDKSKFELQMTEELSQCQCLYDLRLCGKICETCSLSFPPSLTKLVLDHAGLKEQDPLVALGQLPKLECLLLYDSYLGTRLTCKTRAFPHLKELLLYSMPLLEEWQLDEGALVNLRSLKIARCPRLRELPRGLAHITSLQKLEITQMPEEFCGKLQFRSNNVGETHLDEARRLDFDIIGHIPSVLIKNVVYGDTRPIRHIVRRWRRRLH